MKEEGKEGSLSRRRLRLWHRSEKISARFMGEILEQNFPARGAPCWVGITRILISPCFTMLSYWLGAALERLGLSVNAAEELISRMI